MAPEVQKSTFAAPTGRERRQHDRLNIEMQVVIRLVGGSVATKNVNVITAITRDVSEGGMYIELGDSFLTAAKNVAIDNFLIFRSDLNMEFRIPTQTLPLKAVGKSVWIEKQTPGKPFKHGIAIAFKEISMEDLKVLRKFLSGTY